jgi:hypothetical protein
VDAYGVRVIPNRLGALITPSVVGYDAQGAIFVGEAASDQAFTAPDRTMRYGKRRIGERTTLDLAGHALSPEEISSSILGSLRESAESYIGSDILAAVVTVPAHFDDTQRHATLEAARGLVEVPSARMEQTILVLFDELPHDQRIAILRASIRHPRRFSTLLAYAEADHYPEVRRTAVALSETMGDE